MRKTYLRGITFFLLGLSLSSAYADQRSSQEARAIALEKMREMGITAEVPQLIAGGATMARTNDKSYQPYYIFSSDDGDGFVIVSGDDHLPDILGYSTGGTFDAEDMPEGLASLLEAYVSFTEDVDAGDVAALRRAAQMKALRRANDESESTIVEPLLGDIKWGQGSPFNNYCPSIDGNQCVTGCVPVAMAQIMAYYQWPASLSVDIPGYSYTDTYNGETYNEIIPAISAGTVYDWENMLSSYSGSYTKVEADAVATLVYHCAVAAQVDFNPSSSTGHPDTSMWSDYFDYDADLVQNLYAYYFTLSEWIHIIKNELANGRPVMYRGERSAGAHRFVCDGVDSEGLFHVNWGWTGSCNGYFDITLLNPYGDNDGYNRDNSMYVGIAPDNGIQDSRLYETYIAVTSCRSIEITTAGRSDSSDAFSGTAICNIVNYKESAFAGLVGLCITDADGNLQPIGEGTSLSLKAMTSGTTYGRSLTLSFSYAFAAGTYAIIPAYSEDGGTTWKACGRAEEYGFIVYATDDSLSIGDRTVGATVEAEDELLTNITNRLKLTATNKLGLEFQDCLYIYGDTVDTQPGACTEEVFLWVPGGESKSTYIDIEVGNADYYYVWVEDAFGNILVNGQAFPVTYNPTPALTITGVATNASTTDYETENAYFNGQRVKAPIIYDDKFILTSTIVNSGGEYRGNFRVVSYAPATLTGTTLRTAYRTIPANTTVTLCDTLYSNEFDDQLAFVAITKVSDGITLSATSGALKIYYVDSGGYTTWNSRYAIGYFSEPSAINTLQVDDLNLYTIDGCLILTAGRRQTIRIYNLSGQLVKAADLAADETTSINLAPGIYIVDGRKISVP